MSERKVDVKYFLDLLNHDVAIWSIRIVVVLSIVSLIAYYEYKHRKAVNEHNKVEGGE